MLLMQPFFCTVSPSLYSGFVNATCSSDARVGWVGVTLASNLTPCVSQSVSPFVSHCGWDLNLSHLHQSLSKCFEGGAIAATLEDFTNICCQTFQKNNSMCIASHNQLWYISSTLIMYRFSVFISIDLIFWDEGLPTWPVGLRPKCARVDQTLAENYNHWW